MDSMIVDVAGQPQATIPLDESEARYGWLGYWLDQERVVIWNADWPFQLRVVNPFTEEQINIDVITENPDYYWLAGTESIWRVPVAFDPTLRWAVYPADTGDSNNPVSLVLWDRPEQRVLANLEQFIPFPWDPPKWSPDGSHFAFTTPLTNEKPVKGMELFIVSQDGQIIQQTQITDIFEGANIGFFSWSPNGKKIAFRLMHSDAVDLAIFDLDTGKTTILCNPDRSTYTPQTTPIIWSPDSQKLIVSNITGEINRLLLVDLSRMQSTLLLENSLLPVGWMVSP